MSYTMTSEDEQALLDLLNSTPVVGGQVRDLLASDEEAMTWARARAGTGSRAEVGHLRKMRGRLQAVIRGEEPIEALRPALRAVRLRPDVGPGGVSWLVDVEADRQLGARLLLAWSVIHDQMTGRLRPCANDECRLFLLDRSRPNSARWCSMKTCGNRIKARRHYRRVQTAD